MTKHRILDASLLGNELMLSASRSSGPGGQNVNKVNTKIILRFDVSQSRILTEEEKVILARRLSASLTKEGVLVLSSQESRSQLQNKESVIAKFEQLLAKAFEKKKVRKPTRPSKGSVARRVTGKKHKGEKKKWRQKPPLS